MKKSPLRSSHVEKQNSEAPDLSPHKMSTSSEPQEWFLIPWGPKGMVLVYVGFTC